MGRLNNNSRMGQKNPRSVYAIVCEGRNQTEYNYLSHFNTRKGIIVKPIRSEATDPRSMIEKANAAIAKEDLSLADGDAVFCLIDLDNDEEKKKTVDELKQQYPHVRVVLSNPCFEVWFLFHVQENPPRLNNGQAAKKAVKRIFKNYRESYDIYEREPLIRDNLTKAIERSRKKKANQFADSQNTIPNPYTEVDSLIDELKNNLP